MELYLPWWAPVAWIGVLLVVFWFGILLGRFISHLDERDEERYGSVMNKPKSQRGREIAEQRRSNAAGKHGKHAKDRYNTKRKAREQSQSDG